MDNETEKEAMIITNSSIEYKAILESLEIPTKKLSKTSKITPEIEILNEIKNHFNIPNELYTRDEIETYLVENIKLDDFFGFLATLVQPFVKMLMEIYTFLNFQKNSVGIAKSVIQLRIGSDVTFPIDLSHMPKEWQKIITNIDINIWDIDLLLSIQKELEYSYTIVFCDGISDGTKKCKPDCLKQCKEKCQKITKYLENIIKIDTRIRKNLEAKNDSIDQLYQIKTNDERATKHNHPLPVELKSAIEKFIDIHNKKSTYLGKALSDCLPGQNSKRPEQLWTINRLDKILEVLSKCYSSQNAKVEYLKEFLKLPYWRYRNDLYELWILIKACRSFDPYQLTISNLTDDGCWCLPGNGQGNLSNPVLWIDTSICRLSVYTGVKFSNFMFPFEKKVKSGAIPDWLSPSEKKEKSGAMPDWLFCRTICQNESFDFSIFAGEEKKFASKRLVPELIIECKAGASYQLFETLEDTISRRYIPLLRNENGRCFLVNYRPFSVPEDLKRYPVLRKMVERRYSNVTLIDDLSPCSERENEFEKALISFFDRFKGNENSIQDIVFAIDTTGSMHEILINIQKIIIRFIQEIVRIDNKIRIGVIAIGDHDKSKPDPYIIKPYKLSENVNVIIDFIANLERTNGGDAPEAYEDALFFISNLNWSNQANKVVFFIGDSYPHPFSDCPSNIDWEQQVKHLVDKKIKVYGMQTRHSEPSDQFFQYMCSYTNGKCVFIDSYLEDDIFRKFKELASDYTFINSIK